MMEVLMNCLVFAAIGAAAGVVWTVIVDVRRDGWVITKDSPGVQELLCDKAPEGSWDHDFCVSCSLKCRNPERREQQLSVA